MANVKFWYSGWDLCTRWGCELSDLIHIILAHDLRAFEAPDLESDPYSKNDIRLLSLPENHYLFENTSGPMGLHYYVNDVLEVERQLNITPKNPQETTTLNVVVDNKKHVEPVPEPSPNLTPQHSLTAEDLIRQSTRDFFYPLLQFIMDKKGGWAKYSPTVYKRTAIDFYERTFHGKPHNLIPKEYLDDNVFTAMESQHERNIIGKLISKMLQDNNCEGYGTDRNVQIFRDEKRNLKQKMPTVK